MVGSAVIHKLLWRQCCLHVIGAKLYTGCCTAHQHTALAVINLTRICAYMLGKQFLKLQFRWWQLQKHATAMFNTQLLCSLRCVLCFGRRQFAGVALFLVALLHMGGVVFWQCVSREGFNFPVCYIMLVVMQGIFSLCIVYAVFVLLVYGCDA